MTKKIQITDLIPFLKPGFVAMDATGEWYWYEIKPEIAKVCAEWVQPNGTMQNLSNAFNLKKSETKKKKSLIKVK